MSRPRARPRRDADGPEHLILPPAPAASKTRARIIPVPEQAARAYITRRAKPSVVPGHVKLTFTLEPPHEVAERVSARAIRKAKNLEAVVMDLVEQRARPDQRPARSRDPR